MPRPSCSQEGESKRGLGLQEPPLLKLRAAALLQPLLSLFHLMETHPWECRGDPAEAIKDPLEAPRKRMLRGSCCSRSCRAGPRGASTRQLPGEGRDPPLPSTPLQPELDNTALPRWGQSQAGEGQERGAGGRAPAGRHVPALLEAAVQLRQHLLALRVGEGVAEGKVGGGATVLQEAVHEGQHKLRLHHLGQTQSRG